MRIQQTQKLSDELLMVVGDVFNIMKTAFDLIFYLYQAFKQHGHTKTWKQREPVK